MAPRGAIGQQRGVRAEKSGGALAAANFFLHSVAGMTCPADSICGRGDGDLVRAYPFMETMPHACQEEAELIRAFAKERGITPRAARYYRRDKNRDGAPRPEWVEFLRARGRKPGSGSAAPSAQMTELEKARVARDRAYVNLQRMQSAADAAAHDGDDARLALMSRGARDAQRAWEMASAYADKLAEKAGVMIPVENVRAIQRELIGPLGDALRAYRNNIAGRVPPAWRPQLFAAFTAENHNLDSAINEIDSRLEALLC